MSNQLIGFPNKESITRCHDKNVDSPMEEESFIESKQRSCNVEIKSSNLEADMYLVNT